ncbi:MAG: helix-turn-helix transcriptional regulator [Prolixibacteraceae bacterium]
MNNRIKRFMEYKGLSPSELADAIGVQRSNITHVLQGRNKPGFQFINKMLETFPGLNAKWLLTGEGEMLISGHKETGTWKETSANLFSDIVPPVNIPPADEPMAVKEVQTEKSEISRSVQPMPDILKSALSDDSKKIESIVVFYHDQTFKQYIPSK